MTEFVPRRDRMLLASELPLLLALAFAVFVSIPIVLGGISLSSDTLNHHIYLGWVADKARFDRDFLAASYQSYQFPYLYWPIYKLAIGGASGVTAGVILAAIHLLAVPPAWMLARACMPGQTAFDVSMRFLGVLLAFMTSVILLLLDTTGNDVFAAIPMIWAIAFAAAPLDASRGAWMTPRRCLVLSGLLAGASIAFKLSNGPLAILLPGLWWLTARSWPQRLTNVALGSAATMVGVLVTYGYWGWQLWTWFGNPIYPMYDGLFAVLRQWAGWQP